MSGGGGAGARASLYGEIQCIMGNVHDIWDPFVDRMTN